MRLVDAFYVAGVTLGVCFGLAARRTAGDPPMTAHALVATQAAHTDFDRNVWPILQARCAKCHLGGNRKGGLRLDSRDLILSGGDTGPAAVAHESGKSLLIDRLTTTDKDDLMPKKGPPLAKGEIDMLRAWIDGGMPWGKAVTTRPSYVAPLLPRRPAVPAPLAGSGNTNPVDLLIGPYLQAHKITAQASSPPPQPSPGVPGEGVRGTRLSRLPALVDDRVYARRVYMDVLGLLPTPAQLAVFEADDSIEKRTRLVESLLANNQAYAENWMSFWDDALRNDYQGTGYIDGGRTQITGWLYNALASNMPYDQFVRELISAAPGAEGFTRGIIWRGAVSASQRRELQAAQGISQVFLGINMKCASCHDSFINDWKLADAYGMASIYSDSGSIDIFRCEKPTGKTATARFIYPQLGSINAADAKPARMKRLADLITSPDDGRLTRTIVNRLWQRFMGRGIVEPVDDMDKEPWNIDLLDFLASDLADHHYDLKQTIALILTSRAYQMPAVGESDVAEGAIVFRGPTVRRVSAEQFRDAVATVTGIWPSKPATPVFPQSADKSYVRAVWTTRDAIMNAMGRPNREQVVTSRITQATMLQALEFTNGPELADIISRGSALSLTTGNDPDRISRDVFQRALGRDPLPRELEQCRQLLGNPAGQSGLEDLYWAVFMLPEFQLIY